MPASATWEGAPARPLPRVQEPLPPPPRRGAASRVLHGALYLGGAVLVSVLFFLPVFPCFMVIDWLDAASLDVFENELPPGMAFLTFLLLSLPASVVLVGLTALLAAGLRLLARPGRDPGPQPVHGVLAWRRWLVGQTMANSLQVLHGLYASVFAPLWLRLMGARIGRGAEVSTAQGVEPDLLTLGADCFVADGVLLGDAEIRGGWMLLRPTTVGARSFIGNGAYVPEGAVIADDVLIGVQTRSPERPTAGGIWIGSPPVALPARERLAGAPEHLTFRPSPWRRCARGAVELLRIVLPLSMIIACGYLTVHLVMPLVEESEWLAAGASLALAGVLFGVVSFVAVVALKWLLIGRYRPRAAPMWTPFVWLSEAVTSLHESLAVPHFLSFLSGTPLLPWALRCYGCRIGAGCYLDSADITEFDCVAIGAGAELNALCGPQTHLFEDRVMKIGRVVIGPGATLGARTTVLYDATVGAGAVLGPLTLVAKGEAIPPGTCWSGSPAAPTRECGDA